MRTRAMGNMSLEATALGASISQAICFVLIQKQDLCIRRMFL